MFRSQPNMISMRFTKCFENFAYDDGRTPEQNKEDFKVLYDRYMMSEEQMERVCNSVMNHFSMKEAKRSSREQEVCQARTQQAQDILAGEIVGIKLAFINLDKKLKADLGNDVQANSIARDMTFLRREETEEALEFNKRLFLAVTSNDPTAAANAIFESIEHARREAGINSPEDLDRMYDLDDDALLQNYEKVMVFCRRLAEDRVLNDYAFSDAQKEHLLKYKNLTQSLAQILESRMETIANPVYSLLDPAYFHDKRPAHTNADEAVDEMISEDQYGSMERYSPLGAFISSIQNYSYNYGVAVPERLALQYPELKQAILSGEKRSDADMAMGSFEPIIALMENGQKMVLTNTVTETGFAPKMQTCQEYSKELYERAVKADRFLLTGSKQFDDMMKAAKALSKLEADPNATRYQLNGRATEVYMAAKDYLEYKGIKFPYDNFALVAKGSKNAREQSRIETAMTILAYGRAHTTLSEKEAKMEQQGPAKKAEVDKLPALTVLERNDISSGWKRDFLDALPKNMNQLLNRQPPKVKAQEDAPAKSVMSKDDFTLLCALACGSEDLYYVTNLKKPMMDDYGNVLTDENDQPLTKLRHVNAEPDKTYRAMIKAVYGGQTLNELKGSEEHKLLTGAQSLVFHALENGTEQSYDMLGKFLADGLKQNNQVLQARAPKGFDAVFCGLAEIGSKTLELMEKNPLLKAAAMNHLTAEDLRIAKAAKALQELHTEALYAQEILASPRGALGEQNAAEVAAVCQMYSAEQRFATDPNYLATCPYGEYPTAAEQMNKVLAESPQVKAFAQNIADKAPQERLNELKQAQPLADLYLEARGQALSMQQNNQPQRHMGAVAQQPKAPEGPKMV